MSKPQNCYLLYGFTADSDGQQKLFTNLEAATKAAQLEANEIGYDVVIERYRTVNFNRANLMAIIMSNGGSWVAESEDVKVVLPKLSPRIVTRKDGWRVAR